MPRCSRSSASRSSSRRSSSTTRRPARCSSGSRPAASATPTSTRPPASIPPATRRRCSATRGRAWSSASATASPTCAVGDHVVTLFSPQCRECVHCRDERTNLCLAIREQQNQGYLPDGTARLQRPGGEPIRHFMGTSTFAEYTVMPEIALAKVNPEAPLDRACLFACGLSTGLGAAINTAKVREGSTCVGLRRRHGRPRRRRRLPAAGRRADHLRRPLGRAARAGPRAGRDRHARGRPGARSSGSSR